MRMKPVEPRRSLSIYLPDSLYQKLEAKAGRGRLNTFINQVLEKELGNDEQQLRKQLIEAYKREAKSKETQEEMKVWERVAGDSINDE